MSKKKKELFDPSKVEKLNIPEDEIWTFEIDGLQKPRIVDKSVPPKVKFGIIAVLIIAISASLFMSIRAVSNNEYKYAAVDSGIELVKYSNVDNKTEVTIDFENGDTSKPITEIHEYAFNCDEIIETINIGKDVCLIDGKSFFSCKSLRNIFVDDDNPYYCDIDGVLYNKNCTEIICYPISHSLYLTEKTGFKITFPDDGSILNDDFRRAVNAIYECNGDKRLLAEYDDGGSIDKFKKLTGTDDYSDFISKYVDSVAVYRIPDTVVKIGKLAFAYSDIYKIEIPEGVKFIETMAFFRMDYLNTINSYKGSIVYCSLPDGLENIGSDCFSFDRNLSYMFIPSSVIEIGHHAFYNTCYKSDDVIEGVAEMNVAADENIFNEKTKTGESWLPKFDSGLFKKSIDIEYGSNRKVIK